MCRARQRPKELETTAVVFVFLKNKKMEEITFKVDDKVTQSEWAAYKGFIESSRKKLASKRYSHNRPVLYPRGESPIDRFHVVLKTQSRKITLWIRPDNLYLDGYKICNSDQWLVFGRGPGGNSLGFGESYNDMETAAGQKTERINLGQLQLEIAVNQLAISADRKERAKQLMVVIQMICESIRFTRISDHLAKNYKEGTPAPSWMIALEHGWGNLSNALLRADADPTRFFRLPQPNAMQIRTAEEAAAALGILLFFDARKPKMVLEKDTLLRQGRRMAEVFWVRVDDVGGKDPGQLHGTIAVVDGLSSQHLYDRRSNIPQAISPGSKILLTGPDRAISAFDTFTVKLSLRNNKPTPSRDVDQVISDGTIVWNALDTAAIVFDKILHADVKGEHGSARVCYAVFDDAVEATISVELVSVGGKDSAQVYGEIAAFYSNFPSGEETQLFGKKKEEEHVNVRPGQPIGLAKKTVAVPTNYSLIIRAVLHETSPGRDIANGVAVFPPLFDGASQKNITGPYGNILVKVTWNPSWRGNNN